jgi:acetyl-CoA acetyltransferase
VTAKPVPAIIGIGQTDFSRASGRSEWQLAIEAIAAAAADAKVAPSDIDGIVRYQYDNVHEGLVARSLDANVLFHAQVGFGGQATAAILRHAANAIHLRQARIVLCYRSLNVRSGVRYGRAERSISTDDGGNFVASGPRIPSGDMVGPHGLLAPGQVMALWARRYLFEYGIREDDLCEALCEVAVRQRAYANNNPFAMMRDRPLTREDYFAGRMISTPLRLFDYCLESDGAVAFIVADAN